MSMLHTHIHYEHLAKQTHLIRPNLNSKIQLTSGPSIPSKTQLLVTEDCSAEQLNLLPDLRWVILPCAGVPAPMRTILQDRPHIEAHNLHYNNISVVENALTLLLSACKRLLPLDTAFRQGHWAPSNVDTQHAMLDGSHCLILGYGAIGKKLALVLEALGVRVSIMKRKPAEDIAYPCYDPTNWKEILPQTDILISTLPATSETHQIIDRNVLSALPAHAVLINVGRGDNVDEFALFQALQQKTIAAAGLDVWWNYPDSYPFESDENAPPCFPSQYPFQELDNVVMLPHRGADHRMERLQIQLRTMLCERINQASRGQTMPNKINLQLGY